MAGRRGIAGRARDRWTLRRGADHEHRVQGGFLARAGRTELDGWFVEQHGSTVLHGPLAGLLYPPGAVGRVHHLTAKLLGAYERELAGVVAEQIERRPPLFVDLGAADGYYAVGLAHASPGTEVHAYEISGEAKRALRALARANGVQVEVHGPANPRRLASHELDGAFVLCDIEGAELDVLAAEALPALEGATVVVEVHPLEGGGDTAAELRQRFEPSHTVEAVAPAERDPDAYPELEGAPHRAAAVDEFRPVGTSWLVMRPR